MSDAFKHILQAGEGERLKLGPPTPGEVIIKVDPQHGGAAVTVGTQTIAPGASTLVHRLIAQDTVLFVHKGQGRAIVDGRSMTVVPGTLIYAPKQIWHGLQNTGTGFLQVTWTVSPSGIEGYFRELSQLGDQPNAMAIREIGHRYGVEFPAEGEVPHAQPVAAGATGAGGPRRRRRGRGRSGQGARGSAVAPVSQPSAQRETHPAPVEAPHDAAVPSVAPTQPAGPGGRRRRRRGGRGRGRGQGQGGQPRPQTAAQAHAAGPSAPQAPAGPAKAPSHGGRGRQQAGGGGRGRGGGGRRDRRGYRSRVKEVYMGGKWVQVSGEGPVISGEQPSRRPPRRDDDDGPAGPLSVTL